VASAAPPFRGRLVQAAGSSLDARWVENALVAGANTYTTVAEIAASGATAESVARDVLGRIEAAEPVVRAWVHLDPDAVLAAARQLDAVPRRARGPLHGIPLGVKDIFDTHDMPTAYGSPIYAGHRPRADAASVSLARGRGMLPLGKLVTTEFAAWPPGPTTNPHDPARTPGGSSSGSAAAVASGMVPVAFATQTTGSIIRPAAFCGVVGYKPSRGILPVAGAKAISESFDTVGVIARTVADASLVAGALSGRLPALPAELPVPRLGLCLTPEWPAALPETAALFEHLPGVLERAGARVRPVELPAPFARLAAAQGTMWTFEIARCLGDEHRRFRERIREPLRTMLDDGAAMPVPVYDDAVACVRACSATLPAVFDGVDVLLVPAAPGEAPAVATTGDPVFNRSWSALGTPAISVPAGSGQAGLPLAVQVVAPPGEDAGLLRAAAWLEEVLTRTPTS
jgi:amidase